jgi:AAA family ATP:ADP antiporter
MEKNEKYKFIFSSLIMLFTIYILSIFKGSKDTLIITKLGAELISTIKLYGVLPSAFLVTLIYTKLTNYFTRIQIYHFLNWAFITFFVLFGVLLYPNSALLHWDLSNVIMKLPQFKYPLIMLSNWAFSLFYIFSDLWGSMMLALMFWQLMNQMYTTNEAKRAYPLLNLLGELGSLLSGCVLTIVTLQELSSSWDISLKYICISTILAGAMISLNVYILSTRIVGKEVINGPSIKNIKKPGLIQSLKYIVKSKYIAIIVFILICYGASINLIEIVWKKHVSLIYSTSLEYAHFIAKIQIAMSVTTILVSLFGSYILPKLSWRIGALITPLMIGITGFPFFVIIIYFDLFEKDLFVNILFMGIFLGAIQNVISKAVKYSFFEPTKEMVYIPLDDELKSKGKGVADIMGERFGKAISSAIQWFMLSFMVGSTLISISPYLFSIFLLVIGIWVFLVLYISKEISN